MEIVIYVKPLKIIQINIDIFKSLSLTKQRLYVFAISADRSWSIVYTSYLLLHVAVKTYIL